MPLIRGHPRGACTALGDDRRVTSELRTHATLHHPCTAPSATDCIVTPWPTVTMDRSFTRPQSLVSISGSGRSCLHSNVRRWLTAGSPKARSPLAAALTLLSFINPWAAGHQAPGPHTIAHQGHSPGSGEDLQGTEGKNSSAWWTHLRQNLMRLFTICKL